MGRRIGDTAPWVVIGYASAECTRCERAVRISVPTHREVWRATLKAFCRVHRRCRPPREVVVSDFRAVRPGERELT